LIFNTLSCKCFCLTSAKNNKKIDFKLTQITQNLMTQRLKTKLVLNLGFLLAISLVFINTFHLYLFFQN